MTLQFLDEASEEFYGAIEYYEERHEGLGARFRAEVGDVARKIVASPLLWRERLGGYRRVNLPVFPYYIAYFIREESVIVAAVAHARREPGYWRNRKK